MPIRAHQPDGDPDQRAGADQPQEWQPHEVRHRDGEHDAQQRRRHARTDDHGTPPLAYRQAAAGHRDHDGMSPDRMMSIQMIWTTATQNCGWENCVKMLGTSSLLLGRAAAAGRPFRRQVRGGL